MRAAGMAVIFAVIVAIGVVALPGGAAAQADQPKDLAAAAEHYQLAEKAAAEKRWKDAAREYGIAYEHSKDPVLFYKLASAFKSGGDCASALIYFRRYLAEAKPNEQFKKLTEEQIAACEAAGKTETGTGTETETETETEAETETETGTETEAEGPVAPEVDDESPPLPVDASPMSDPSLGTEPSWQRTAAWISVGIAVAFGTTGGVLGLAAGSREDDINAQIDFRDPTQNVPARFEGNVSERYDDLVDQGERFELLSMLSFAAAGAAVGAAVVFFILDPGPDAVDTSASIDLGPAIGPDTVGVSAGWRFE